MTRAETIRAALDVARNIRNNIASKLATRVELAKWIEQDAANDRNRLTKILASERRLLAELLILEDAEASAEV